MSQTPTTQTARASSAAAPTRIAKILVPIDFGAPSMHALAYAKDLARSVGATVDVLSVVTPPYVLPVTDGGLFPLPPEFTQSVVRDAEMGLARAVAVDGAQPHIRATVTTGDPRAEILKYAETEHVDLIVMGTRGRTGAQHLIFGSVAEHVVRTAPCPVLTIR